MSDLKEALKALLRDQNLDVEDLDYLFEKAMSDKDFSLQDQSFFTSARYLDSLEPAARQYLEDRLAGRPARLVPRVLLAPVPNSHPDLYQPRAEVVRLQEALNQAGFSLKVDGWYGTDTAQAVKALQARAKLPATGLFDTTSLKVLNQLLPAPLDLSPRARIRPDQVLALRGNPANGVVLQTALVRLGGHFGVGAWKGAAGDGDGVFGGALEGAVKELQKRHYLPETGILDQATARALAWSLEAAGISVPVWADMPDRPPFELHFYPGDHELKLYVQDPMGRVVARYGMVGGRKQAKPDPNNPQVGYDPTPAGRYEVIELSPHSSSAWAYSYVPYGAALREVGGEIEFQDVRGNWQKATGPQGVFAARTPAPLSAAAYYRPDGSLPAFWELNDFGHLRGRLKSQGGTWQSHMIHSSPDHQETASYFTDTSVLLDPQVALERLRYSHGCEHIHPRDLDELVARGFLCPGAVFVVHGYDARHPENA